MGDRIGIGEDDAERVIVLAKAVVEVTSQRLSGSEMIPITHVPPCSGAIGAPALPAASERVSFPPQEATARSAGTKIPIPSHRRMYRLLNTVSPHGTQASASYQRRSALARAARTLRMASG